MEGERARFEGLGIRMADLQGFFYHAAHVAGVVEYRVLPPFADAEGQTATGKTRQRYLRIHRESAIAFRQRRRVAL